MGLIGMQERAALLGGNLEVRSTPLKGTRLTVYLPLIKPEKTPHDE
jgi:signal transduction histidine kinase